MLRFEISVFNFYHQLEDTLRNKAPIYLIAAAVGAFSGLIGAAFHHLIEKANSGRISLRTVMAVGDFPGWLVFAVLGGLGVSMALLLVRRLTFTAEALGSRPVYRLLLERRLRAITGAQETDTERTQ